MIVKLQTSRRLVSSSCLQGSGNLLRQIFPDGATFRVHSPEYLIGDPAPRDGVVLPLLPLGVAALLLLQDGADGVFLDVLCPRVLHPDRGVEAGEAGLVPHQVRHRDLLLAVLSKLGPVAADPLAVGQQTLGTQHGNTARVGTQSCKYNLQISDLCKISVLTWSTSEAMAMAVRLLVLLNTVVRVSAV